MDIQFVRLEDDVCTRVNAEARDQNKKVSELVNQILREHLAAETAREDVKPAK